MSFLGRENRPSDILGDIGATDATIGDLDASVVWTTQPRECQDGKFVHLLKIQDDKMNSTRTGARVVPDAGHHACRTGER